MNPPIPDAAPRPPGAMLLRCAARIWYLTMAIGLLAFVWFIVAHYWSTTLAGNPAGWNTKPLIKGYVQGDRTGNLMFGLHVLLAAVMTLGGLLQLVPALRQRAPALHRWNGRLFLATAFVLALGGLWLVWVRSTWLSLASTVPLTLNALLILLCGALALKHAVARRLEAHRRWAIRTFLLANGVWLLRVAMMAWVILSGGGSGLTPDMSGPVDLALQFGCYLVPLAVLELHFRAQRAGGMHKRLVAVLVLLMTAVMAVGVFGTVSLMWWPYMM